MKIAIYSPYLDTAGGGEKYMLTIAEFLSSKSEVDVLLDEHLYSLGIDNITNKVKLFHGLDLSKVNFIEAPFGKGSSFFERLFFLRKYNFLFYLTDGSIFYSTVKNSILHFQFPIKGVGDEVWDRLKLSSWNKTIFNSNFTKDYIEKAWGIKGMVVYPPVNVDKIKPLRKEKMILSVGRFSKAKKHDFLINAFKKMNLKGWSLHLVGGEYDTEYLEDLRNQAKGQQIFFHQNLPLNELIRLYGKSQIYWHAAGFGETDPTKMEHFGITTVEAMAAGCIPVVINSGGQTEIVEDGKSGLLWNSKNELLKLSKKIIDDPSLWDKLSKNAIKRSIIFNKENFYKNLEKLVYAKH